jgi:hypothetical protein
MVVNAGATGESLPLGAVSGLPETVGGALHETSSNAAVANPANFRIPFAMIDFLQRSGLSKNK